MIYESFGEDLGKDIAAISNRVMLVLAVATSIDALAAGYTLSFLDLKPMMSVLLIGVTTFIFSFAGVFVGERTGTFLVCSGSAFHAAIGACMCVSGLRKTSSGSIFNRISFSTERKVERKRKRDRSRVPNRLDTAGKSHPLIFSKSRAGPPF